MREVHDLDIEETKRRPRTDFTSTGWFPTGEISPHTPDGDPELQSTWGKVLERESMRCLAVLTLR